MNKKELKFELRKFAHSFKVLNKELNNNTLDNSAHDLFEKLINELPDPKVIKLNDKDKLYIKELLEYTNDIRWEFDEIVESIESNRFKGDRYFTIEHKWEEASFNFDKDGRIEAIYLYESKSEQECLISITKDSLGKCESKEANDD